MEFKQGPLMWEAHGQPMGQSRGDPHQPPDFQTAVRRATMLAADEHALDIEAAVLKEMRQYQVQNNRPWTSSSGRSCRTGGCRSWCARP